MMWKFIVVALVFYLCEGKRQKLKPCPVGGGNKKMECDYWRDLGYCDPANGYDDMMNEDCPVSCGLCEARPTKAPEARIVKVNIRECLQAHNSKREEHGAKPLRWDASLAKQAKKWALHLANKDVFEHAPPSHGAGENIFWEGTSDGKLFTCKQAVEKWYAEVSNYNFENPARDVFEAPNGVIGHFTQVVWKSTNKVGVAIVAIKRGFVTKTYIVARYMPPGNAAGKFGQEVGPPSSSAMFHK